MDKGYLILEDGSVWEGERFGFSSSTHGEVVFTTGMVGYPESLTDPSYEGQIVVATYPLQGNYGVPRKNPKPPFSFESNRIHAQGFIVSSLIETYSHWNAVESLDSWLRSEKIPGLFGIDTRTLTIRLREKGVMLGMISNEKNIPKMFPDPNKENLVKNVSTTTPIMYGAGSQTVIVVDCGVKLGIIAQLVDLGLKVMRVPWDFDLASHKERFSWVLLTNGPGDPTMADRTIELVRYCLSRDIPTLGVCLGNQILALGAGGKTYKLPYGHRSHNQPSLDRLTKKAYMTTQNHGFAVDVASLSSEWEEWFVNLNDQTNEGIRHKKKLFRSTQFHPEGRPGPHDTSWVFEEFVRSVAKKGKTI